MDVARMRLRLSPVLLVAPGLVLLLAVAAGCSSAGGNGTTATATRTPRAATATAPGGIATASPAAAIDQKNTQFVPTMVSVKVGDTVLFKNSDPLLHTIDINGKNVTGNMNAGDVIRWQAPAPGTYVLTCDYHPQMRATIIVTP